MHVWVLFSFSLWEELCYSSEFNIDLLLPWPVTIAGYSLSDVCGYIYTYVHVYVCATIGIGKGTYRCASPLATTLMCVVTYICIHVYVCVSTIGLGKSILTLLWCSPHPCIQLLSDLKTVLIPSFLHDRCILSSRPFTYGM